MTSDSPSVGTFDLELDPPLRLSLLSFDVVSTPSGPGISVGVSENGVAFAPASSIAFNGYRINAWLVPRTVRFVRLTISPTHPDTLGGGVYTFGLTDISGWAIDFFHLRSEWVSKPVPARPRGLAWRFRAGSLAIHTPVVTIPFHCRLSLRDMAWRRSRCG